jgi:hypothetical protein
MILLEQIIEVCPQAGSAMTAQFTVLQFADGLRIGLMQSTVITLARMCPVHPAARKCLSSSR